jgi:phosphatidylinositol alpha-mannosyltransferase
LSGYYQHADLFCAPNTGKESFGMIVVEAMAAGTPVVATDILGFRSVMQHERQGLLVPPKSEQGIADAIERLIQRPGERTQMGVNGSVTARMYNWEGVAAQVMDYYGAVLERRPVPPALYKG